MKSTKTALSWHTPFHRGLLNVVGLIFFGCIASVVHATMLRVPALINSDAPFIGLH